MASGKCASVWMHAENAPNNSILLKIIIDPLMVFTISWIILKGKWGLGLEPPGVWEMFGFVMMMEL